MNLHETIYRLRTQRGLSQLELAEALEVSRQSISKWETGAAVPELDKLVKLSDVFGITLDELVRGTAEIPKAEQQPQTPSAAQPAETPRRREPHRIVALVLLCMSLALTALLVSLPYFGRDALIAGLPLVAACVVLLILPRRHLLWGFWTLWIAVFLLMEMLFDGFLHIRSPWLMLRCLSWLMIFAFVPLIVATVRRLKR